MTTPLVPSITDEQLSELESLLACDPQGSIFTSAKELGSLISRLRAAERDAERYRWLRDSVWYVGPQPDDEENGYRSNDKNWRVEGIDIAIDAAMLEARNK